MLLHVIGFCVVLLAATPGVAQDRVDFLFDEHPSDDAAEMMRGTVAFAIGTTAYFASSDATHVVDLSRKKPRISRHAGHPHQAHHKSAESIVLGPHGALVILADDRRRLKLLHFDTRTKQWTELERPIGFVPRVHAVVGKYVVFPQTTRSPAWYTYDIDAQTFTRVDRPREAPRCDGTVFADGSTAIVAGVDDDGQSCAVRFDPAKGSWSELDAPPAVPGPRSVRVGRSTYLLGPLADVLSYRNGAWASHVAAPDLTTDVELTSTSGQVVAWEASRGAIKQWSWSVTSKKWASSTESITWSVHSVVALGPTRWLAVGVVRGAPSLLQLDYAPKLAEKTRAANRANIDSAPSAPVDWKTASEQEKQKAIKQGLGSVERYVPPERDANGKVTTKGAWLFALGEELVVWPTTPKQCRRFLERMIAQWPTEEVGTRWMVERGSGFARVGKKVLYSPAAQCREASKCPTDFFSETVTPLSQVGPIFSFTRHQNSATCDKAHASERWVAIDLRSGKPASLTAVIKEDSILKALKRHKKFRETVADAASLDDALVALRKVDPHAGEGYAFGSWRAATRTVQLRLEFHPERADHVEPIHLWVEPKDEFIEIFEEAARTPGRYMSGS